MSRVTLFITGTDTGVGKTVLAVLLARCWREAGVSVGALKPFCSGGREDASALRVALGGAMPLDEINPWHFAAPLTPLLAARREGKFIRLKKVLNHLQKARRRFDVTIVEGAGGLLSPLGEDFSARELIARLQATPIVVCPNRLGAINQTLLVMAALPRRVARRARVVLMSQPKPDSSARSNLALLTKLMGPGRVKTIPWLQESQVAGRIPLDRSACRAVAGLLGELENDGLTEVSRLPGKRPRNSQPCAPH